MGTLAETLPKCASTGENCALLDTFVERMGLTPDQKAQLVLRCQEFNDSPQSVPAVAGSLCLEENLQYESSEDRVRDEQLQMEALGARDA